MKKRTYITRKGFIRSSLLGLFALGTGIRQKLFGAGKKKKYNVLFLMTDEHSPHFLHCDGNELVQTPALDIGVVIPDSVILMKNRKKNARPVDGYLKNF